MSHARTARLGFVTDEHGSLFAAIVGRRPHWEIVANCDTAHQLGQKLREGGYLAVPCRPAVDAPAHWLPLTQGQMDELVQGWEQGSGAGR